MGRPLTPGANLVRKSGRRGPLTKATIAVLGIDLGKSACSIAGLDFTGAAAKLARVVRAVLRLDTSFEIPVSIRTDRRRPAAMWIGIGTPDVSCYRYF